MSKKRTMLILTVILLLCAGGFFSYNLIKDRNNYGNIIKENWNVELPLKYKEIYSIDSGDSFLGDGKRYHVFEYDKDNNLAKVLNWQSTENPIMESSVSNILKDLKVPEEYMPKLEDDYKYYFKTEEDSSELYIIFIEKENKVYVAEDIR